eukprot:m.1676476 g.1676476  ORF g.1676476 m.1676476 type:complete len:54 (+) comp189912_c0_seq1:3-164(+)
MDCSNIVLQDANGNTYCARLSIVMLRCAICTSVLYACAMRSRIERWERRSPRT